MRADYLDASAIVKLIVSEPETEALQQYLRDAPSHGIKAFFSSRLGYTEVMRAVRRRAPELLPASREYLRGVHWLGVTEPVIEVASSIGSDHLRTLDSLHLATALQEASVLRHVVVYDARLAQACREAGLHVVVPGR